MLPLLPEQRKIAAILLTWDHALEKINTLIEAKKRLKRGLMQVLLTGQKRFSNSAGTEVTKRTPVGHIPVSWTVEKLERVSDLITKGTTPTTLGKSFQNQGVHFLKVESITEDGRVNKATVAFIDQETHILLRRSRLQEGDILFSIAGALGRTAVISNEILPANINQALAIIRLKREVHRNYVFYFLDSGIIKAIIKANAVQQAQPNLSLEQISQFLIPLPTFAEQKHISDCLSSLDREIALLEKKAAKFREQKRGLMQKLLTGAVRVRA